MSVYLEFFIFFLGKLSFQFFTNLMKTSTSTVTLFLPSLKLELSNCPIEHQVFCNLRLPHQIEDFYSEIPWF